MNPWQKLVQFFGTFRLAFAAMRKGRIWVAFLLYALVEGLILAFTYFGVRPPFTDFFAGPLSFIVPEQFFHYPVHLALVPAIFSRISLPFGILLQSILYAAATLMFVQFVRREPISPFRSALAQVKAHYMQFVFFALLTLVLFVAFTEFYSAVTADLWTGYAKRRMMVEIGGFLGAVMINCLFAYSTAVIVVEGTRLGTTVVRSLRAFMHSIIYTFLFVLFSSLLILPLSWMEQNATEWMGRFNPEVMILLVAANIVIGMIAYFIGTATLTFWYIFRQEAA